jgi:hypothetical protein
MPGQFKLLVSMVRADILYTKLLLLIFLECTTRLFVHSDNIQSTNATLILHGYIGASPQKVSRAFPIRLFEIYRQIHRVCPRYTIETLATTLTNLHEVWMFNMASFSLCLCFCRALVSKA